MDDVSARDLLECFHRYLDSDVRWQREIAPGVYEFCGARVHDGSSVVDVASGTFRHRAPGSDYEVLSGELLSIVTAIAPPASATVDECIRKLLDGTRTPVIAH